MTVGVDDPTQSDTTSTGALEVGAKFGRYEIRTLLGAGGMGAVFLADDPLLARTVAIKILKSGATDRLLDEGRVMAKLNHPNVIHVYDVGIEGEIAFVAMEHIKGCTLREWLEQPRSLTEIIEAFAQAGRGLAAAHDAGLVHRDFTLTNVMVDSDGRVVVTDFGLAKSLDSAGTSERSGTPAYMSPEQHAGSPIDLRSDVFSFCVAMWRAVYGEPPFPGETWREVAESTRRGIVSDPAEPRRAPRHVRSTLERGLRADPDDRWPTMDALVAALIGRRRRAMIAAILATAAIAIGATAFVLTRAQADPCAAAGDRLAGIWDEPTRALVKAAFGGTGDPQADKIFATLAGGIDSRTASWETMRRTSCEATNVRHEQSDTALDLRSACLDGKLAELAAFVHQLETGPKSALYRAQDALASVADVSTCSDATLLARRISLPSDPARRRDISLLDADLVRANATVVLNVPLAAHEADGLVDRAKAAGYPPTLAFALTVAARDQVVAMHATRAEPLFEQAVLQADAAGDDAQRFDIELGLGLLVGLELERFDDGARHLDRSNALLARTGTGTGREAQLLDAMALLELRRGKLPLAEQHVKTAIARSATDEPERAKHLVVLGAILLESDRPQEAVTAYEEALAINERLLGPNHPRTAGAISGRGGAYRKMRQYDKAMPDLMRAYDIFRATYGEMSFNAGVSLANIGILYDSLKQLDKAEDYLRRAYEIYKTIYGPDHSRTVRMLYRIGTTQTSANHLDAAEPTLVAALAGLKKVLGENHRQVSDVYYELGSLEKRRKQPAKAAQYYEAAAAALVASEGPDSKLLRRVYKALGDMHGDLGDYAAACKDYEAALRVAGQDPAGGKYRAELEGEYGFALVHVGRRDQALAMVKSARERFVALGDDAKEDVAELDSWLKSNFPGH